ncbi:MAG: hypothetical protein ABGZ17_16260 [Planctomycetaceae bacterium]
MNQAKFYRIDRTAAALSMCCVALTANGQRDTWVATCLPTRDAVPEIECKRVTGNDARQSVQTAAVERSAELQDSE